MTVEAYRVRIFKDSAGEFRWTARDTNGEPIADSDEGFTEQSYATKAALDLFPNAIIEIDGAEDDE